MIKEISIYGLRGFGKESNIEFAIPNSNRGSGITFFVGGNNTGKTTILEGLRSFIYTNNHSPSFSERKRNSKCEGGRVHLKLVTDTGTKYYIDTVDGGGSQTTYKVGKELLSARPNDFDFFILQSRRFVDYEFSRNEMSRYDYTINQQRHNFNRTSHIDNFNARLFRMLEHKREIDPLLKRILGYDLEWTIEQNENGSYYLKFIINGHSHSSEGLGDGIWSVFTICDALYDSDAGSTIAIDEPELSLHPSFQKRIMELLKEYSTDRQIIICTHSTYFVDWPSLVSGAKLYRTVKDSEGDITLFELSDDSRSKINGLITDINHPHTLGTEAKEIFFLEDRIIVTEGQEDVIMYQKAIDALDIKRTGTFFGWGSGGATKIPIILRLLHDLGYKKVSVIFDGDKQDDKLNLEKEYTMYNFQIISRNDIRDKKAVCKEAVNGMMTSKGDAKEETKAELVSLLESVNNYMDK